MDPILRLGVTKHVYNRLGKDGCVVIGGLVARAMIRMTRGKSVEDDGDGGGEEEEGEEEEGEEEEDIMCGVSVIMIDYGARCEVLMGLEDQEPWSIVNGSPKPKYKLINKWFEL